jgi:hypothetical protein
MTSKREGPRGSSQDGVASSGGIVEEGGLSFKHLIHYRREGVVRSLAISFLLVAAVGCASGGDHAWEVENLAPITEAELAEFDGFTALGALRTLRPDWVGPDADRVKVFCTPNPQGDLDDLKKYMATEVREIRFHPSRQTTADHATYAYITVTLKG